MPAFKDLSGRRFGRLLVEERAGMKGTSVAWRCLCLCGKRKDISSGALIAGRTLSCGCLGRQHRLEARTTHGATGSKEYRVWQKMLSRCTDTTNRRFKDYGGRGITVCTRWRSFENFLEDMGQRPSMEHTIDRINNEGNYEPSNCRWATRKEQARNTRRTRLVTFDGVTKPLAQWAEDTSIPYDLFYNRWVMGWSLEEICRRPRG